MKKQTWVVSSLLLLGALGGSWILLSGRPGAQAQLIGHSPECGNGYVEYLEDCDDGNLVDGDGCPASCLWEDYQVPTDLEQRNEFDGAAVPLGRIINEGAAGADAVLLSARVVSADEQLTYLEVEIDELGEDGGVVMSEIVASDPVGSGEIASIDYVPRGGRYSWRARTVDAAGQASGWIEYGDNGADEADFISSNFSFVFMTDVHLGSNGAFLAAAKQEDWYETQSYPRFTDALYEIEHLEPRPDFILIGGDNVEYNNVRWLQDFKSLTEKFSQRTGIGVHFVPGNHDRYDSESSGWKWGDTDFSGGNDNLANYFSVMGKPEGVTSLFADDAAIMNAVQSEERGLNRYNYYFEHKGFQFIGLDSGEDTGVWDPEPEESGLSDEAMNRIISLAESWDAPRIVFMHSPIYADEKDPAFYGPIFKGQEKTDTGEVAENGGIVNNWRNFLMFCDEYGIQVVLSGHNHESWIFDQNKNVINLADWKESKTYPLYLQTQSAGKGDDHGFRVIKVENGKAVPQEAVSGVAKFEKIYSDLDAKVDLNLSAYGSNGERISAESGDGDSAFSAAASDRLIIYDDTEKSKFVIGNPNPFDTSFDLQLQKREAGVEIRKEFVPVLGYRINNPALCGVSEMFCPSFISLKKGSGYSVLGLEDIKIKKNVSDKISVDWNLVKSSSLAESIKLEISGNSNTTFGKFPVSFTADLNSPGELRVVDQEGNVTGMVDGEIVEDVPYSVYVPESETVYVFGDARQGEIAPLKTQVVGTYEAPYDLSIALAENDQEIARFVADDVLTDGNSAHQFSVDWDALARGEDGVTMQFDENGDGQFDESEKTITTDGSLSFSKAKLNAEKYTAKEGEDIIFDASGSSDADGSIVSYEWDFDGDGIYEEKTAEPIGTHSYGDDYQGKIFLRVTGEGGLTDAGSVTSAEVIVANVNPVAAISKFEIASEMDRFVLEGNFSDTGWLDQHTASIDWGDGFVEDIALVQENLPPAVAGKISAAHRYAKIGNYVVKLTVMDDDGGAASPEAVLKSPRQIKQNALMDLESLETDNKNIRKEIDKATKSLQEILKNEYWQDDFHLRLKGSPKFLAEEQKAIKGLEKILKDKKKYDAFENKQEIQSILDELTKSDILLARVAGYEMKYFSAKNLRSANEFNLLQKIIK